MTTQVIFKIDKKLKERAMKRAENEGLPFASVLKLATKAYVEGDLTIRGITKRITLPVRIAGVNKAGGRLGTLVGFESEFTINREDFDVGEGWSIIDKEARIHLLVGAGTQTTASR